MDGKQEAATTPSSEAEVRLVFRFSVEEHLVYRGKVERVQQLQNEELSRLVSRVAWDGAKEAEKSQKKDKSTHIDQNSQIVLEQAQKHQPAGQYPTDITDEMLDIQSVNETLQECLDSVDYDLNYPLDKTNHHQHSHINLLSSRFINKISSVNNELSVSNKGFTNMQEAINDSNKQIETKKLDIDVIPNTINNEVSVSNKDLSDMQEAIDDSKKQIEAKELLDINVIPNTNNNDFSVSHKDLTNLQEAIDDSNKQIEPKELLNIDVITNTNNNVLRKTNGLPPEVTKQQSYNNLSNQNEKHVSSDQSRSITQQNKEETTSTPTGAKRTDQCPSSKRIRKGTPKDQRNLTSRKTTPKPSIGKSASKEIELSPYATTNGSSENHLKIQESDQKQAQTRLTNKIFAKWTDNHYYPGTILRQAKDRKYVIGFLDGAQRNVAEADLIPLSSIQGRQVRFSIAKNYCVNALVHDESPPVNDQPMFEVEYQQDGSVRRSVPFKDIFLTGDQASLLINQVDRVAGGSNFADVDLDNIIYEKRSRRLQDMEDYEFTENPSISSKKKRGKYNIRNSTCKSINNALTSIISLESTVEGSPASIQSKRNSQNDNIINNDSESTDSPEPIKTNFQCPNSNVSESSSSTGSSNVNALELGQEFYFGTPSPHRTKTSLLL